MSDGDPEDRPRPVVKLSLRDQIIGAAVVLTGIGGLLLGVEMIEGPRWADRVRADLEAEGYTDVSVGRSWFARCPHRSSGYRWTAAEAEGRACIRFREPKIVVDRGWAPRR